MVHLDKFVKAVAMRKPLVEGKKYVDAAIVMQMQEMDIPRLLEIIRVMADALWNVEHVCQIENEETYEPTIYDIKKVWQLAKDSLYRVEELSEDADLKDWGDTKHN